MLIVDYPKKQFLKAAVGKPLRYSDPDATGEYNPNGVVYVVGPSSAVRHWFARVNLLDGLIVSVEMVNERKRLEEQLDLLMQGEFWYISLPFHCKEMTVALINGAITEYDFRNLRNKVFRLVGELSEPT